MDAIVTDDVMIENPYQQPSYPVMLVISGPSGAGKDTIVRQVIEADNNFHFVVTATTRLPRPGEVHGVDYFFVSEGEFDLMIEEDELLEYAWVHDNYKGVPKQQIREALASGRDVIMRVDPQGAATLREIVPEATFVFLMAESEDALRGRLTARNTETTETFNLRLNVARDELRRIEEFNYCVVNRDGRQTDAAREILSIVQAEKCRVGRQPIRL